MLCFQPGINQHKGWHIVFDMLILFLDQAVKGTGYQLFEQPPRPTVHAAWLHADLTVQHHVNPWTPFWKGANTFKIASHCC
eukprot:3385879-Amphidinium_carterae.3